MTQQRWPAVLGSAMTNSTTILLQTTMNNAQTSTPRRLYPLLVGINNYPPGISPLRGCVEDIRGFQTYLQHRVADQNGFELQTPHVLLNHQATRAAVINGFTETTSLLREARLAKTLVSSTGRQCPG